jgi:hypothetical protein
MGIIDSLQRETPKTINKKRGCYGHNLSTNKLTNQKTIFNSIFEFDFL